MDTRYDPSIRWDVISRLHCHLKSVQPGDEWFDIADHAISLALSPTRSSATVGFLTRSVLRDSRHIVRRSRKRRPEELIGSSSEELRLGIDPHLNCPETPEELAIAAEAFHRIRGKVGSAGANHIRCLDGILAGETVEQTGAGVDESARTVKRLRAEVRRITVQALGLDGAP